MTVPIALQPNLEELICSIHDIEESDRPAITQLIIKKFMEAQQQPPTKWESYKVSSPAKRGLHFELKNYNQTLEVVIQGNTVLGEGSTAKKIEGTLLTFPLDNSAPTRKKVAVGVIPYGLPLDDIDRIDHNFELIRKIIASQESHCHIQPPPERSIVKCEHFGSSRNVSYCYEWVEDLYPSRDMTIVAETMEVIDNNGVNHPVTHADLIGAAKDIFSAIKTLHIHNLVYADPKPTNWRPLYEGGKLTAHLADFGLTDRIGAVFPRPHNYSYWDKTLREQTYLPTADLFGFVVAFGVILYGQDIDSLMKPYPRSLLDNKLDNIIKKSTLPPEAGEYYSQLVKYIVEQESLHCQILSENPSLLCELKKMDESPEGMKRKWEILNESLHIDEIYTKIEESMETLQEGLSSH